MQLEQTDRHTHTQSSQLYRSLDYRPIKIRVLIGLESRLRIPLAATPRGITTSGKKT